MIPNIAQSIDDIIKGATPEQKILWQHVRLLTGENASIRQLFYHGSTAGAGAEFITYSANKLYLCTKFIATGSAAVGLNLFSAQIHNEANTIIYALNNSIPYWDATAAAVRYANNSFEYKNFVFSRLTLNSITGFLFNGFRINY